EPHYIMGTLWTPPANCKTNNSLIDGGHLKTDCYESWSNTIAAFADKISQNTNTTLYAMSPQNETDFASCGFNEPCNGNYDTTLFTGKEAANFQKIVGPKLRAKGVVPMSAEASEWLHVWSNESACCSEPSGLPSSDPFACGGFHGHPVADNSPGDHGGYDYWQALHDGLRRLRLRARTRRRSGRLGRLRYHGDPPVRFPDRVSLARRRPGSRRQRGVADGDVGREMVARTRTEQHHRKRRGHRAL